MRGEHPAGTVSRVLDRLRAAEDVLFDVAAALEHRLGLAPRTTRIVPRPIDRHLVRVVLVALPILCASLLMDSRPVRARIILATLTVAFVAVLGIFLMDRRRSRRHVR